MRLVIFVVSVALILTIFQACKTADYNPDKPHILDNADHK